MSIVSPLQASPGLTQLLALSVNGVDTGREVEALPMAGGVALPADVWQALGIAPRGAVVAMLEGRAFHRIEGNDLQWKVDDPTQPLLLESRASAFAGSTLPLTKPLSVAEASAGIGAFMNYDVQAQGGSSGHAAQGLLELGAFGVGSTARQTLLARSQAGAHSVRLDSTMSFERPGSGASLRVGDGVVASGTWGRALRFGGVQWSTDFALRPDLQTMAAPVLRGETALPSTVDVLLDGNRRLQGQVGAGPFTLTDLPVVTGSGEVKLVVRDLLGREQLTTLPYYASPALLRPGLAAQSFEAGALREDYGLASNHYGRPFVTATDRRGLSNGSTRELRAEVAGGQFTGGMGVAWPLPAAFGVAQVGLIASRRGHDNGAQVTVGAEHQSHSWSGNVQWRGATPAFTQLGQSRDSQTRSELALALGSSWRGIGFGGSVVRRADWQGRQLELWSANVSWQMGAAGSLGLFLAHDRIAQRQIIQVVWSLALDARQGVSLSAAQDSGPQGGNRQSAQWQRNADDGTTWRLLADRGALRRDQAEATWATRFATLNGALAQSGYSSDYRVGASGAVAWAGDSAFVGRRIDDSFAVVQVADYADVPVLLENRPVAVTNSQGRAFVTGLRGREVNRLSIDASNLPFDADLSHTERFVVPPERSGVVVDMPLQRTRAARFRLVDNAGQPLPAGSQLLVEGRSFPVGFDGLGYATGLQAQQTVQAHWPGHRCKAALMLPDSGEPLPDLGTVTCQ